VRFFGSMHWVTGGSGLIVGLLFLFSSVQPQESEVDDEICLMCHEDYDMSLSSTKHRLLLETPESVVKVHCISCHTGAEVHIDDPDEGNIGNPAKAFAAEAESVCTSCHQPHTHIRAVGYDPHFREDISCTSCHRIHSTNAFQLIDEEGGFCSVCHVSIGNEFRKRSNHPLSDQAVTCMSCHDFTGRNEANLGHGSNANCYQCHPEQSGPYLYEHQATSSFSTEGEGCTACHLPHGSPNERLLARTGDLLCLQCHGTPPLHRVNHDGIGIQFLCVECHSEVHGSYTHRRMLDQQLGTRIGGEHGSCYCHGVGD